MNWNTQENCVSENNDIATMNRLDCASPDVFAKNHVYCCSGFLLPSITTYFELDCTSNSSLSRVTPFLEFQQITANMF